MFYCINFINLYLIWNRLTGEEPFRAKDDEELYKQIFKGEFNTNSENYANLSTNAKVINLINFYSLEFISKLCI